MRNGSRALQLVRRSGLVVAVVAMIAGCTSSEKRWEDRAFDEDRSQRAVELVEESFSSRGQPSDDSERLRFYRPAAHLVGTLQASAIADGRRLDARQIAEALVADVSGDDVDVLNGLYASYRSDAAYQVPPNDLGDLKQARLDDLVIASAMVASQDPELRSAIVDFLTADEADIDGSSRPQSLERLQEYGIDAFDVTALVWITASDIDDCRRKSASSNEDCPTPDSLN